MPKMLSNGFIVSSLLLALSAVNVYAAPLEAETVQVEKRQTISSLSATQISAYKPYTYFASAAYCTPAATKAWNCGANCAANSDFVTTASGGDGSSVQYWYVGYSSKLASVIVGHQGTDPSEIEAWTTDANAILGGLDSSLFPGVSSAVEVHEGFRDEQAKTASAILAAVQSTISAKGAKKVAIVGHSLGAAIALLDAVYLPLHISGVTWKFVGYGMPRVGNQDFANYVDSKLGTSVVTHINNKEDFVPILPGRFLGYHHSSGEVHIQDSGAWTSCPGQDNTSSSCTVGDVSNVFEGSESDHDGPYDGIVMGC
ncbi:lipase [Crepidotus variabilis]|uniref:Lipase n=1 Tax=Crepidotus variabilis TaxID=179855 RepID=A0A9P6EFI0_9AGAR|nr:lipase [Crepidotus variabilis]